MQPSFATELSPWLVRISAFVFGAIWGSFFNVAIYRWPRGMSVVSPPSHCPHCAGRIPPYLNVPIISHFVLRGKAACCGAKISSRYVLVEIIGAVLCVAVAERFFLGAAQTAPLIERILVTLCYFAFGGGLVITTFIDLQYMEIPDEVSLPLTALGLATAAFRVTPGVEAAALGAGAGYLVVQLLFVWCYERLTGRRGMGEGDAKLLMAIGAFIGWQGGLFCLMAGAAQGLLVALPMLLRRKGSGPPSADKLEGLKLDNRDVIAAKQATLESREVQEQPNYDDEPPPKYFGHVKIPFGPFLALGALEYLFFGEQILNAYFAIGERLANAFHGLF